MPDFRLGFIVKLAMKINNAVVEKNNGIELDLEVIPNSKEFEIVGFNPWTNSLKIKVKEVAEKGKANKELVKALEKILKTKVEIIKGKKNRQKKIFAKIAKEKLIELLKTKT